MAQVWCAEPSSEGNSLWMESERSWAGITTGFCGNRREEAAHIASVIVAVLRTTYLLSPNTTSVSRVSPSRNSTRWRSGAAHKTSHFPAKLFSPKVYRIVATKWYGDPSESCKMFASSAFRTHWLTSFLLGSD